MSEIKQKGGRKKTGIWKALYTKIRSLDVTLIVEKTQRKRADECQERIYD